MRCAALWRVTNLNTAKILKEFELLKKQKSEQEEKSLKERLLREEEVKKERRTAQQEKLKLEEEKTKLEQSLSSAQQTITQQEAVLTKEKAEAEDKLKKIQVEVGLLQGADLSKGFGLYLSFPTQYPLTGTLVPSSYGE